VACFIPNAAERPEISQIQADLQLLLLENFVPKACTVLIFLIAGLLFLVPEHVIHRELIASRSRPAFSSHHHLSFGKF
jgi:hypothetical protein